MKIDELLQQSISELRNQCANNETPELDVQLLLSFVLAKPVSYLFTWPQRAVTDTEKSHFDLLLARRLKDEPIAYILGYQEFWSLKLEVSRDTLIPRPDTELLVEMALDLERQSIVNVADLGTGTGAVALAVASERPEWFITATDYVEGAVALAERNRANLDLVNVRVLQGSWFEPLTQQYDLIVSNPPYIEEGDAHLEGSIKFEPNTALTSGEDGLVDIRLIVDGAPEYLNSGGWLMLEHGYNQGSAVRSLLESRGFKSVRTCKDLAANDRVTIGQW